MTTFCIDSYESNLFTLCGKHFSIGVPEFSYLGSKPAFLSQSASGGIVVVEGVAVVAAMVVVAMVVGGKGLMVAAVVVVDGGHLGSLLLPDKKKSLCENSSRKYEVSKME
jgi:hypothetical protein